MAKFDWREYLTFSYSIKKGSAPSTITEAVERIAISRAYYGLFGIARRYLIEKKSDSAFMSYDNEGMHDGRKNVHWHVIESFKKSSLPEESLFGDNLSDLRVWRNEADYNSKQGCMTDKIEMIWALVLSAEEQVNQLWSSA